MKEKEPSQLPYQNPQLPVEDRVRDLLGRMTPEEKARQLDQHSGSPFVNRTHPRMSTVMADEAEVAWDNVRQIIGEEGVGCIHDLYATAAVNNALQRYAVEETRLGIPILFSEEALHGLGRPGCTVFPHAITQAGTWDPEIVEQIGRGIAAETRSRGIHETFSPVLDLAREPRWGRTEETYGEDTWLASRMAVAMVRGLQGAGIDRPDSIIAEPKHFAVHGIPESGLNAYHCSIGMREMMTCHLPVFEAAFVEGGATNAMCSYNAIDGVPCAAHRFLLTDVLRGRWGMKGFVRSDLGAIALLQNSHRTADSPKEAIRQSLQAGTDMQYYDYPHELHRNAILELVREGALSMETLDEAVGRVLRVKFLLGLFERPYTDEALMPRVTRCARHGEVALTAAREAICLLKNDGILPLDKKIGTVAVIGPSAAVARLGDYTPYIEGFAPITVLDGIRALVSPETKVLYAKGTGILPGELEHVPADRLTDGAGSPGLLGRYFSNPDLAGEPAFTRLDPQVDFNWVIAKPDDRLPTMGFSVRWTGRLTAGQDFTGYLGTASHDSMRLWVDGALLVDGWGKERSAARSVPFTFRKDANYDIRLEYRKDVDGAEVLFGWNRASEEMAEAVAAARRADVAVLALGDNTKTCGEGLDRMELDLPGRQKELLQAVHATGTPVVLVLQNGRPLTLTWEDEHLPAIVEAWYPGEQGGRAVAEVLFGDYNPAGRLPVSFPKAVGQLPVYYNRKRTVVKRYVEGDSWPLYAFGHGLSYTTFAYENLRVTPAVIPPDGTAAVEFDVVNTGERAGDEVAQLYVSDLVSSVVRPEKELRHFRRLHLRPGERKTVRFELTQRDFRLLNLEMKWAVEPGVFALLVGPSSDNILLRGEIAVAEERQI